MPDEVTTVTTDAPAPAAQADTSTADSAAVTSPGAGSSTTEAAGAASGTLLTSADAPVDGKPAAGTEGAAAGTQWEPKDLTLPEGSTLDAAALERIAATARERGLPKDAAQALVELVDSDARQRTEAQAQTVKQTVEAWKAESLKHPEIGATPAERDRNLALAKQAAVKYFGAEALPIFESTGIGNHPALLAGLIRIAKASGEGSLALPNGAPGGTRPRTLAEALYGDSMDPKPAA